MDQTELAGHLVTADDEERAAWLARYPSLADAGLARALKAAFDDAESSDPERAIAAAAALGLLAAVAHDAETGALAAWTAGMAAQLNGQMEESIAHLDDAEARFQALQQCHNAAATQVSKLFALAVLGRYDEALACGERARDVFVTCGDIVAAGKIEQNLGNIHARRECYAEAERLFRSARDRFLAADDQKQLAQIDNCLANVLTSQHRFAEGAKLYEQALARAEVAGLDITQAEIECNLGCLALYQGRYDRALDYLERSRRRYAALGMPHDSAIAEQELADAYLELNLAPEAAELYARALPQFVELGMRAEQARTLAYYGRACFLLGEHDRARELLAEAGLLYEAEENAAGRATVLLTEAQMEYAAGNYAAAASAAARAEGPFATAGVWGRLLLARWLHGEATRALGKRDVARTLVEAALSDAEVQQVPQVAWRCHTSLGLLAASAGDGAGAEESFKRAVAVIEDLRAPLPADEFRTAFLTDKLPAYTELVRLCLADGSDRRAAEALGYVERARSRALLEMMAGALRARPQPRNPLEAELLARLDELRAELNWFYTQINRPPDDETFRSAEAIASLQQDVRERESAVLEITRQIQQCSDAALIRVEPVDMAELQRDLGPDTALVEYFSLDGNLLAFVVTGEGVEVVRGLGSEGQVEAALSQLHFQLGGLRYGAGRLRAHLDQLALRARHYLSLLYDVLLRPIEGRLGGRRLVIVPHRALHYVPFHALFDGSEYVIERREVSYAPSAAVLRHCCARAETSWRRAVLLGVPDAHAPRVRDEVIALTPLFPTVVVLLDEHASLAELRAQAPGADVLHLACHGRFRPDNPLFSSLRLADGWLTVHDAYSLDLDCSLVTLSACETGMSVVAPGDDLIGLARGFFAAGALSLVVSLWTVDDESTTALMASFYERLLAGDGPAAALRHAQRQLLHRAAHPFFWAPFVLLGRW